MAENNSKTFIIGIIIFVLLVIGSFAFFAKKDVPVDQTSTEVMAPADGASIEVTPTEPAPAPAPVPAQSDDVTPTADSPAYNVEATPAPAEAAPADAAPAAETPATEAPKEETPAPAAE